MGCCYGCVAPKRHPGCHCPEYIEERAEYDRKKAAEDKKNAEFICRSAMAFSVPPKGTVAIENNRCDYDGNKT